MAQRRVAREGKHMADLFISRGLDLGTLYHAGIVVHNLEEAIQRYTEAFRIGEWHSLEVPEMVPPTLSHGQPVTGVGVKLAYVGQELPFLELLQPLGNPEVALARFLRERGEGLHHLGYF